VRGGTFSASVDLEGGVNVIDVVAAAPRHPAAMTAVRVTRIVPVRVPPVSGLSPDDAVAALREAGLEADIRDEGGFLDDILPGSKGVCGTDPGEDERVRAGTTVTVVVAESC
jgi:beta-lactam-binding protein with PASTA domain